MPQDPLIVVRARAALGNRLAMLRSAAGHTQTAFARLTFYGRSSIANIEIGRQAAPRDFWARCDDILGTDGVLADEHDRLTRLRAEHRIVSKTTQVDVLSPGGRPVPAAVAADAPAGELLAHLAGVAAACGLVAQASPDSRRRIASTDIDRLLAITELYRSVDRERGGMALRRQLAGIAEAATLWLDPGHASVSQQVRRSLASAVAGIRLMAGWTAFDAGFYEDSHRHFVLAERAATHAEDPPLIARVRYCQTRHLQHRRHNVDALHTVQFARIELGGAATPGVLTMLLGAEAASLAALGRRDDAPRCLEQAADAYARVSFGNEPSWMRFYDDGEFYAQYGRVYRDLARCHLSSQRSGVTRRDPDYGAQAVHWVQKALAAFGPDSARSILLNRIGLVSALMLAHAPDLALTAGNTVLTAMADIASQRVIERIRHLPRDFESHQHRADVSDFAETLGRASTAPT